MAKQDPGELREWYLKHNEQMGLTIRMLCLEIQMVTGEVVARTTMWRFLNGADMSRHNFRMLCQYKLCIEGVGGSVDAACGTSI